MPLGQQGKLASQVLLRHRELVISRVWSQAANMDNDNAEKKWVIDQLGNIIEVVTDELRGYSEGFAERSDAASDSITLKRNEVLAGIVFFISLFLSLASLHAVSTTIAEGVVIAFLVAGLIVYLFLNYVRGTLVNLIEVVGSAYDQGADRCDFFRGQFYAATVHLDRVSLEQLYLSESFIKVLVGEAAGNIRGVFEPLLHARYASISESALKSALSDLDSMIKVGYDTYVANKTRYQDAKVLLGSSLPAADQFQLWFEREYPKLKMVVG